VSATRHVETDALAAVRAELVGAAGRRISRRRGRRRTALIIAVATLLAAATAATAALIDSSTGVPAVDKLLDVDVPPSRHPAGPGSASDPLRVPEGDHTTNVVAYHARDGSVCVTSADLKPGGSVRGGFGGCPPLSDVNRRIERRGAVWFGSSHGADQRTYQLIVGGDVDSIRALEKGHWTVKMTPPWTPRAPDARPLRLVVAIDDQDLPELEGVNTSFPKLELRYADGSTRLVHAP